MSPNRVFGLYTALSFSLGAPLAAKQLSSYGFPSRTPMGPGTFSYEKSKTNIAEAAQLIALHQTFDW